MRYSFFTFLLLSCISIAHGQSPFISNDIRINKYIEGTLLAPRQEEGIPMAIIINDAGFVDREGNQPGSKNDAVKKLAEQLAAEGIASFRYDKRILKASKLEIKEKDFHFDDFITDANTSIAYFKHNKRFSKIYVIGHGQGSLVGMIAAQENADGFISIAGAGEPIDQVLLEQIGQQAPGLRPSAEKSFKDLKKRGKTKNFSPALGSIFRKDIQPFMASWMAYNPKTELAKLHIPVLLISGDKDLLTPVSETTLLKKAKPDATLTIIKNMNHVFRIMKENDDIANHKTYNQAWLPISKELVSAIAAFIKTH